jgi:glutamyl-tRNA reductase
VALHKVKLLLEGKANVWVVSPEAQEELRLLAVQGDIRWLSREFSDSDVAGMFLVFAATDSKAVNRHIVELCRGRGILCCAVNDDWIAGDFVTPAILRKDGLTVSISTGGQSCRRSRMVKENLGRHIDLMRTADLLVLGTSHHQLSIEEREPFHLSGQRHDYAGQMLAEILGVHEFLLLSTCNRVEVHAMISCHVNPTPLLALIMGFDRLQPEQYYVKRGYEAFEHVAMLSAGLLAQTLGENHIVAQVKEALERAVKAGWARGMMREWISAALHMSKDIRTVTGPLLHAFEIEDVCVEYVRAEYPELEAGRILVLGAGTVGMGIARRFLERGRDVDLCYHIHSPELVDSWKERVRLFTFDDLRNRLDEAKLVVCATDSPHYVLMREHAPYFDANRPVLLMDLTMPRNVDPALNGLHPNLRLVDLEDLKHWFRREAADIDKVLKVGNKTVSEHVDMYEKIIRAFEGGSRQIRSDLQSDNAFIGAPAQPSEEPVASVKG